jgi:hypothetical protein
MLLRELEDLKEKSSVDLKRYRCGKVDGRLGSTAKGELPYDSGDLLEVYNGLILACFKTLQCLK